VKQLFSTKRQQIHALQEGLPFAEARSMLISLCLTQKTKSAKETLCDACAYLSELTLLSLHACRGISKQSLLTSHCPSVAGPQVQPAELQGVCGGILQRLAPAAP